MSAALAKQRITDAQAMRWARDYFKAEAGDDWAKPPRWSQLVKIVDQMRAEIDEIAAAMHDPLAPGAAALIVARADGLLGDRWEDDDGNPVSDSCLWYYAKAFEQRAPVAADKPNRKAARRG